MTKHRLTFAMMY